MRQRFSVDMGREIPEHLREVRATSDQYIIIAICNAIKMIKIFNNVGGLPY